MTLFLIALIGALLFIGTWLCIPQFEKTDVDLKKIKSLAEDNATYKQLIRDALISPKPPEVITKGIAEMPIPTPSLGNDKFDIQTALSYFDDQSMQAKAQEIEKQKSIDEENKVCTEFCSQPFNHVIVELVSHLKDLAKENNYTLISEYKEMPPSIPEGKPPIELPSIQFKANKTCNFTINVTNRTGDMRLFISSPSENEDLYIRSTFLLQRAEKNDFWINVTTGNTILYNKTCTSKDYYQPIEQALIILIFTALKRDGINFTSSTPDKSASQP